MLDQISQEMARNRLLRWQGDQLPTRKEYFANEMSPEKQGTSQRRRIANKPGVSRPLSAAHLQRKIDALIEQKRMSQGTLFGSHHVDWSSSRYHV